MKLVSLTLADLVKRGGKPKYLELMRTLRNWVPFHTHASSGPVSRLPSTERPDGEGTPNGLDPPYYPA